MKMSNTHQSEGEQDQEDIKYPSDRLLTRLKDHARHQSAGCSGDSGKKGFGVGGRSRMEVEETEHEYQNEGGGDDRGDGDDGPDWTSQMIADIDRYPDDIGSGEELDKAQSRKKLFVRKPAFLRHDEAADVGGQASAETCDADEGK